jgi:hypothetical protein
MAMQLKIRKEPEGQTGQWARLLSGSLRRETRMLHAVASVENKNIRTCTHCGVHVAFRIDPLGCWAECPVCGHLS